MSRSPSDLCLLCQKEPATQTNSHLIPRFLSAKMLLNATKQHFIISRPLLLKYDVPAQSTPKENFLLCPNCEKRLSFVERYIANMFINRYQVSQYASDFPESSGGVYLNERKVIHLNQVDPSIVRLFVYSILWRVAVSHEHYPNFNISADRLKELRNYLDKGLSYNGANLTENTTSPTTIEALPPYNIFICLENKEQGINFVTVRDFDENGNEAFIAANELHIYFNFKRKSDFTKPQRSSESTKAHVKLSPLWEWEYHINQIRKAYGKPPLK